MHAPAARKAISMHCEEFQRNLSRPLDGELAAADLQRLSGHRAVCLRCRQDWELLMLGHRLCEASRRTVPVPGDFAAGVLRSVRTEKVQRSALWVQLGAVAERMLPAFAMLVILFLGIFFASRQRHDLRRGVHDSRELFVAAEDEEFLIAKANGITADRVIKTVLEGK